MSYLLKDEYGPYAHLNYTDDEKIGTFWVLHCEKHGDTLSFTDKSGADNCIECIKELIES
jgi:hypothetical protein